ncbi:MAG TPA: hypothetical protein VGM27_31325 [Acidobacteriaceae bacterium]
MDHRGFKGASDASPDWSRNHAWNLRFLEAAMNQKLADQKLANQELVLMDRSLKTPRAAAIAGILFAALSIAGQLLIRSAIPADPLGSAVEVVSHAQTISRALNLVPFAGIAFLWFIAVFRDHLGELEDRFFATVVLGSGLLYVAMYFTSAALAGGLLAGLSLGTENLVESGAYAAGRAQIHQISNIYGIKMAGVFMISTSTVALRTRIVPRWMIYVGYALALFLLLTIGTIEWTPIVFPLWVLLMSVCILMEKFRG